MFDLGWPELLLIMVVALVVIGPKELPNAIRTVSAVMRKVRGAAREFQNSLDDIARESGLDDVKRQFDGVEDYDVEAALDRISESDRETTDYGDEFDPTTGEKKTKDEPKADPAATVPDAEDESGPTTAAAPAPSDAEETGGAADGGGGAGEDDRSDRPTPATDGRA